MKELKEQPKILIIRDNYMIEADLKILIKVNAEMDLLKYKINLVTKMFDKKHKTMFKQELKTLKNIIKSTEENIDLNTKIINLEFFKLDFYISSISTDELFLNISETEEYVKDYFEEDIKYTINDMSEDTSDYNFLFDDD